MAETVDVTLDAYSAYLRKVRGFSALSINAYCGDVRSFFSFCGLSGHDSIQGALTLMHARHYLASLQQAVCSRATLARRGAALRSFSHWLFVSERTVDDFAARLISPSPETLLPKVWDVHQTQVFFRALDEQAAVTAKPKVLRSRAVFELLYSTGIRVGELSALDIFDVDYETCQVSVVGKGNKERRVPFGVPALNALTAYLQFGRDVFVTQYSGDALFVGDRGGRLADRVIRRDLQRWCVFAGVPQISPHSLRHAAATHMLQGGADMRVVQEILGHSSLDTTQRYTHVDKRRLMESFLQAHPHA